MEVEIQVRSGRRERREPRGDETYEEGKALPFDIGKVTDPTPDLARAGLLSTTDV